MAQDAPFVFTVFVDDGEGGITPVKLSLQVTMDGFIAPETFESDSIVTDVDPYEFLEGQPIDLKRYFYDRALENRDDQGRMFGDKAFLGGMVASPIQGMSNDCAHLVVETVAFEHNINVQLASTLTDFCDVSQKLGCRYGKWREPARLDGLARRCRLYANAASFGCGINPVAYSGLTG